MFSKELFEELHKLIISIFKKAKVNTRFINNIQGASDIKIINKLSKGTLFFICYWNFL